MVDSCFHKPVMVKEVLDNLITNKDGVYADCTFGGGGHSKEILKTLSDKGELYGFDQDEDAQKEAEKIVDGRFFFVRSNFKYVKNFLEYYNAGEIDGVFIDLGVSSYQIDTASRGFSIRFDGDLDMRMNKGIENTAAHVIQSYKEADLFKIFKNYGELHNAKNVAKVIVESRKNKNIKMKTTGDLVKIITDNIKLPHHYVNRFLAQIFQAIRIEVNSELNNLIAFLEKCPKILKKGGRLVSLSYHPLEDRIIKDYIKNNENIFKNIHQKPLKPTQEEIISNIRARTAKLRVVEKS